VVILPSVRVGIVTGPWGSAPAAGRVYTAHVHPAFVQLFLRLLKDFSLSPSSSQFSVEMPAPWRGPV
jgi:hypothetical protein